MNDITKQPKRFYRLDEKCPNCGLHYCCTDCWSQPDQGCHAGSDDYEGSCPPTCSCEKLS